ncbi:MAG: Outer membrane protein assembly factor BamA [Alphaproteobacteria bacterium MarineAlpha5_Bin6]|nr:MAG: Outer membrane protein assembly factor BamA [Alphaproteobacteria bacterium MarineAlpha5_Bin7]PPR53123.1 MAG: Outer membrane protein assembly factor BamA [Alphaproteobacteria bacterium MarineAlpha5_Bin6]|tara:strand:- start:15782 stop:18046 length:2265 start_codon:yes stop_codon:yes gene_type:complete
MRSLFLFLFFSLFFSGTSFADSNKEIIIQGNEYIDDDVIYSIIGKNTESSSSDYINKIIKSLYDTGNFKNIDVKENDEQIILYLIENSRISKINLVGNERFKKEFILEQFNENEYFKYINEIRINKFITELKKLYESFGYNQINIEYKILEDPNKDNSVILEFYFDEGTISKINRIYFVGNESFDKQELMSEIKSNQQNFILIFRNENYKEYQVTNDVYLLEDFYKNNGFRDIEISYKSEYLPKGNKFNVYFYIEEGKKYEFGSLDLNFDSIDINTDQQEKMNLLLNDYFTTKIQKNNIYNRSYLDNINDLLSEFLFDNGIIFFNIRILDKIDVSKVDILFQIESSEPKYVDQINIYGNTRTIDKVIRREMTFSEGDAINSDLIKSSKKNIDNLRIFKSVDIKEVEKSNNQIDINIFVEEQTTGEFQIGLSFGTIEGATFVTGLREKNIAGIGREIDLTVNTSDNNTKYNFDIIEPYIFNRKLDFIYGISYSEEDLSTSSSYKTNTFNTKTGFRYVLDENLLHKITLEYRLKEYLITDTKAVANSIHNLSGHNADILLNNILISDGLNSFIRPTKGQFIQYENIISPSTNSDNGYVKNLFTYKKYIKNYENIFSIRAKAGNIVSLKNKEIATDDKFSLGGYWLRGFDSYGAGPRDSRTSYIGGRNVVVTKFDLQRPLNKNSDNPIDLNIFSDFGTVFDNKNTPNNSEESIRSSYGFGIKFYTPIGPIGLSWAFPISSESYDIERMFLFSIGNLN